MRHILTLLILFGCAHTEEEQSIYTVFDIGECVMIIDKPSGMTKSENFVVIEDITDEGYVYRWWMNEHNDWADGLSEAAGKFEMFDKISKKTQCPVEIMPLVESL